MFDSKVWMYTWMSLITSIVLIAFIDWTLTEEDLKIPSHFTPRTDKAEDFRDSRFIADTEHIKEDLEAYFSGGDRDFATMSNKELQYYYFELHDFDKNGMMDGLEMLQAVRHVVQHGQKSNHGSKTTENMDSYALAIDEVLKNDDLDNDGYLNYDEFIHAQKRYNQ